MKDNIMFYPAIVLMIVEVAAAVFLIVVGRGTDNERKTD